MSPRTLILLTVIALCLAGVAGILLYCDYAETEATATAAAGQPLVPEFSFDKVHQIVLTSNHGKTLLSREKSGKWTVRERAGYPASDAAIGRFLSQLRDARVSEQLPCPKSRLGKLFLTVPTPPAVSDTSIQDVPQQFSDVPVAVELYDANCNAVIPRLICGKQEMPDNFGNPAVGMKGRYYYIEPEQGARSLAFISTEALNDLKIAPQNWIDKTFIAPKNILSLAYSPVPNTPEEPWTLQRPTPDTRFTYCEMKAGESIDSEYIDTTTYYFQSLHFNDVKLASEFKADSSKCAKLSIGTADSQFTLTLLQHEKEFVWVSVSPAVTSDSQPWVYRVPAYVLERLTKTESWLKRPLPANFNDTTFNIQRPKLDSGLKF